MRPEIQARGGEVVVLSCGKPEHIAPFREATGYDGSLLTDPSLRAFQTAGLAHGWALTLNPASMPGAGAMTSQSATPGPGAMSSRSSSPAMSGGGQSQPPARKKAKPKGTVLGQASEIPVGGLTPMELEDALREALSKKYLENPQVSVFVKEHGSKKVSVLGAVGKPGVYEMLGARTLLQILSEAGGLTKEVGAELYVIRARAGGGVDKSPVDVLALMTGRDPALNLTIQPGDIVSVPLDRPIYIYVDGAVKTPGRLEELASRPITLGQAIAKAGGATDRANLKAIQILRKGKDGEQTTLSTNLNRIRKGKDPDQVLQDGDVVVVPETFF